MSFNHIFKKRPGALLADKDKHEEIHKEWSRRSFIKTTGLATFGLSTILGKTPILTAAESAWLSMIQNNHEDKILVLINLNGGNDGLNTVIDRFNDEYYSIRPTIAIQESNLWPLTPNIGMHGATQNLQPLWDNGQMKVIQNVGYANPNYSHFRSSDIWASASESDVVDDTGWIGRYIQEEFPAFLEAQPTTPPAIQIGVQTDLTFKGDEMASALAFRNPGEFYQLASSGNLYPTDHLTNSPYDTELTFVRRTANSAFRYSNTIRQAYNSARSNSNYPDVNLGRSLSIVSRLIKGGLKTKVYMVTIGGFDTHANQADFHALLLQRLADSVSAFYSDLGNELSQKVLSMTFSEFGRTIFENGSVGTDHGTGAPILMFGGQIGQGIVGSPPNLLDLDHYGDPYFDIDFKDVYNTVINQWFGIDPRLSAFMLGNKLQIIPGLLPDYTPPAGANAYIVLLGHKTQPDNRLLIQIQYALLREGDVVLELLDPSGQVIRNLMKDFKEVGTHSFILNRQSLGLKPGKYLYQIKTGGKIYQRPIWMD